jgi:4-hydroxy-4-methyl-2-oxoglutarate aldolase
VHVSTLERLSGADSAALSDALDRLGLDGVVTGIAPLSPPARVAGPAATVRLAPAGATPGARRHLATAAIEHAEPGDVLVVAYGGPPTVAIWGGNLHTAAGCRSIAGVVLDGATRDADEIRELDPPLFGRGTTPRSARGRLTEEAWNVPVTIGEVLIRPGDLVFADGSGVVIVPAGRLEDVLVQVEEIVAVERLLTTRIRAGEPVGEVLGSRYERGLER